MNHKIQRCLALLILFSMLMLSSCAAEPSLSTTGTPEAALTSSTGTENPTPTAIDYPAGVKTDYSGLTTYTPPEEKFTTRPGGPLEELLPSASYGMLLPYIGETMFSHTIYTTINMYGFITDDGMIITKPSYSGIYQGSYYTYTTYTIVTVPAYDIEKLTGTVDKTNPWDMAKHAACALDGSWVTNFDYRAIFFTDKAIMLVRDYELNDLDIMDYNGKLLFNTKSLDCYKDIPAQSAYTFFGGYGDGITALPLIDGRTAFIDVLTGNVVYAEYTQASTFSEGVCAAMKDGLYGFIDKSYSMIIEPQYIYTELFKNGKAIVEYPDYSYTIIDIQGNSLVKRSSNITSWTTDIYGINDRANNVHYYDAKLEPITAGSYSIEPINDGWFSYTANDATVIFKGHEEYTLINVKAVSNICGNLVSIYENVNNMAAGIITLDGKEILPISNNVCISLFTSEKTDKTYALIMTYNENQSYSVLDISGQILCRGLGYAVYNPQYDVIEVSDETHYAYIDMTGKNIFRISLLEYAPD